MDVIYTLFKYTNSTKLFLSIHISINSTEGNYVEIFSILTIFAYLCQLLDSNKLDYTTVIYENPIVHK